MQPICPPLGDLTGTVIEMMTFTEKFDLKLIRRSLKDEYRVSRVELTEVLGNLEESTNIILAKDFLKVQEDNLRI